MPRKTTAGAPGARTRRSPARPSIGLALAGGGPLGGIYEVGALLALADSLEGLDLNDLDAYVGVSSGGFVAAALANGISPAQMYRLFIDDGAEAALKPEIFLRPALGEFRRRAAALPGLTWHALVQYARDPFRRGVMSSLSTIARAIPTGMFDNRAIDEFLARLFSGPGRTNDFRKLRHKLFLVATNLDTGLSVTFGAAGQDHVPISRAIEASSALPGLFPPVAIGGEHYVDGALNKTLHASVALEAGIKLLLCVNPLVPFDASSAARRGRLTLDKLNHGGLPLVLSQTFRAIIHSRLKVGMEKYRRQYPDANVVLIEPDREDADMFFANIFSYSQRKRLCATAFATTRYNLRVRAPMLAPVFARHGITIREDRLSDSTRDVRAALCDPRPIRSDPRAKRTVRRTARELSHTLDQLERWVHGRTAPAR
ncbi:MAG: patatin-like phospholipase family protein [Burkholderiales bacterium]|nr:patatin-like phospholipase family protein [Burkholderiales bacterium]MBP6564171.1 patatin-like phospholipase family protein [Burkholderiales bacterium]